MKTWGVSEFHQQAALECDQRIDVAAGIDLTYTGASCMGRVKVGLGEEPTRLPVGEQAIEREAFEQPPTHAAVHLVPQVGVRVGDVGRAVRAEWALQIGTAGIEALGVPVSL